MSCFLHSTRCHCGERVPHGSLALLHGLSGHAQNCKVIFQDCVESKVPEGYLPPGQRAVLLTACNKMVGSLECQGNLYPKGHVCRQELFRSNVYNVSRTKIASIASEYPRGVLYSLDKSTVSTEARFPH